MNELVKYVAERPVTTTSPARASDLTIADVARWVRQTLGHHQRLVWFRFHEKGAGFYEAAAIPLLSIRITGSMTVERVAKDLKQEAPCGRGSPRWGNFEVSRLC